MKITVSCDGLEVKYGLHCALSIESLSLEGRIIALLGHNGAGKSTFMKSVLDLLPHRPGSLEIRDQNDTRLTPSQHMAFCPETGAIFEDITVAEYVALWCRLRHGNAQYYRTEGRALIEALEVEPLLSKKGRELSKGQRRRVQTAIAFLTKPRLFLIDEPFDGLDVQRTQELTEIIRAHGESMSFIISSHRMDVMVRLADTALVLEQGTVATAGSIETVCQSLAGESVVISHSKDPSTLSASIRKALPHALVTQLGEQISISSPQIDRALLEQLVSSVDRNGAQISEGRASLTDAMSVHLRAVKARQQARV